MSPYSDYVRDQYERPVPGALIYVYDKQAGALVDLRTQSGAALPNPLRSDSFGYFSFYAADGTYRREVRLDSGVLLDASDIIVGNPPEYVGPTGPANSTYTSLGSLKAAAVSNASYIFAPPSGSDGGAAAGTFLYQTAGAPYTADGVNVIKLDAAPLATGALVRQGAQSIAAKPEADAALPPYALNDAFEFGVRLTKFGAKFDGVTDDTAAWKAAIAFVASRGIRTVIVPQGRSRVTAPIVDGGKLPRGIRFIGEGKGSNEYSASSVLKFEGTGICFRLDYADFNPPEDGHYSFYNIGFESGTCEAMFEVNGMRPVIESADATVKNFAFYGCYAVGGGQGDFFRGSKVFALHADDQCIMRGWRRAFWLIGCDNCYIAARLVSNGRHIMHQRSSTYGNNLMVAARYMGELNDYGEPGYMLWDEGNDTTVMAGALLEDKVGGPGTALIYMNGIGLNVSTPYLVNSRAFHLGPRARECLLDMPQFITPNASAPPMIEDADYEPGSIEGQQDFRLTIRDLSKNGQSPIQPHPRLRIVNPVAKGVPINDVARPVTVSPFGAFSKLPPLTALNNYWTNGLGSLGGGRTYSEVDGQSSNGWAIALRAMQTPASGLSLTHKVFTSMPKGLYLITYRTRYRAAHTGQWDFIVTIDGAFVQALPLNPLSTYATQYAVVNLNSESVGAGNTIGFHLYNGGGSNQDVLIDAIDIDLIRADGWTAGTGTALKGAFNADQGYTAGAAYSQTDFQAVIDGLRQTRQRVLAVEAALRNIGAIN